MELVGAHHPLDVVPVPFLLGSGEIGEEPRHLDHELEAGARDELEMPRHLPVLPGLVGDRQAHMPLMAGSVGYPPTRQGIEQEGWRLVASVAAALPREHGAAIPGRNCRSAGRGQATSPIGQGGSGRGGKPVVEHGKEEEGVPKDMAEIPLAMQASRAEPGIELLDMG